MKRTAALALFLVGCAQAPPMKEFRPAADVEVLASPDAVQAFRLTDGPISPGGRKRIEWHQWPVESSAVVDTAAARDLSKILADPSSSRSNPSAARSLVPASSSSSGGGPRPSGQCYASRAA